MKTPDMLLLKASKSLKMLMRININDRG